MHYTSINCVSDKYLLSRRPILGYRKEYNKVLTEVLMMYSTVQRNAVKRNLKNN